MSSRAPGTSLESIVSLCKRRAFIYPASEIYGGVNGFWDYGPMGVELKNNLRDAWWHDMVRNPPAGPDGEPVHIVGLDSAIIQNPAAWEASGHVGGFSDPMVDCRETKARYRADHLFVLRPKSGEGTMFAFYEDDDAAALKKLAKAKVAESEVERVVFQDLDPSEYGRVLAPGASAPGSLTEPRAFNLMFKTFLGAASGEDNVAYLRPETAQGIFLNFKNVVDTMRVKVPFGIAQIGKAFRNEVTPRNFVFRSREFEQMEMEFFCHPDEAADWYRFWVRTRRDWWASLGISAEDLTLREHDEDELAHYGKACADVEYRYPFTAPDFGELEGIAHRGDFDLSQHQQHAKVKLEYFDPERNERFIPQVIEPASGLTRGVLVLLCEAYTEEWVPRRSDAGLDILPADPAGKPPEGYEHRHVMKFSPRMAPVKLAVFPLLKNKPELVNKAREVYDGLRPRWPAYWDAAGAIGKRYRRQDEIGTPFCLTIDFDTLEDDTVTVRDRDSMEQERVAVREVEAYLAERMGSAG